MTIQEPTLKKTFDWRAWLFRIMAILFAFFFMAISAPYMLWPWNIMPVPLDIGDVSPEIMRWHAAAFGSYATILTAVPLLLLLKRPREKPLLMQFWLIGQALSIIVWNAMMWSKISFDFMQLIMYAIMVLVYPAPRELFQFKVEGQVSKRLLGVSLVVLVVLLPLFWKSFQLQLNPASQLFETGQYVWALYNFVLIPLAGFLSASKRPGWKTLLSLAGIALLYLGVSAVSVPNHDGSWGLWGGMVVAIAGIAYLVMPRMEGDQS